MFVPRRPSTSRPTHIVMHADPELRPTDGPATEVPTTDCYIRTVGQARCGECPGCKRYYEAAARRVGYDPANHAPEPILPRNERIRVDVHPRDLEIVAIVARQAVRTFAQTTLFPLEEVFNYRMPEVVLAIASGVVTSPEYIDTNMPDMPVARQSQYYLAFTTITCLLTATALMREAGPHG